VKSCIFVIRWLFHAEIVFFEESVLWNTPLWAYVCSDIINNHMNAGTVEVSVEE
jgi:hypothetical protein